jgi:transposase
MCKRIVFSDEHTVSINDHTRRRMWVAPGASVIPRERRRLQNIPRVMVWAAVGIGFKSPIVLFPQDQKDDEGKRAFRLEKKGYVRRCLSIVVPRLVAERRIFQQDGAKCHQNTHVRDYLKSKKVEVVDPWPAYSPDLNMIELLWPLLNERVAVQHPSTLVELEAAIQKAWDSITQAEIDARCAGFGSKVVEVVRKRGTC